MTNNKKAYIKRPLATGTLFYIIGLVGGELHCNPMRLSLFLLVVFSLSVGIAIIRANKCLGFYLIISLVGVVSMAKNPVLQQEAEFARGLEAAISLKGIVLDAKAYDYKNHYIIKPTKESKIKSKIKVETGKDVELAKQGDMVTVTGKIEPLSFPRNPGAFNERTYLLIRQIAGKMQAETFIVDYKADKTPLVQRVQAYYGQVFERLMPDQEAQIMKAMLLGDKGLLPKAIQNLYKDVGIAHVLAISGLHISIITGLLWWVLKVLGIRQHWQSAIVLGVLWLYAALTGFSISITRSAIMMSVIIMGNLIEEKPDPITSWSFAGLVLLAYNNLYLWDIGFQLSFAAVGSLIILTPFFKRIYQLPEGLRSYLAPLIAVTVGTTPIIAYYYYVVTPISVPMNLILIPIITLVVMIGFLAMVLSPISLLLAKIIIGPAYYLLLATEKISKLALKIPFATLIVGRPSALELGAYGLFMGILIIYLKLKLEQRKRFIGYALSINILLVLIVGMKRVMPGPLKVTFLDVGQGDAIVITTPNHKTFLIDGGLAGNGAKIEQYLKYCGILKVHGAILSHAHADHMDGLGELAQTYGFDDLFLWELPLVDPHFKTFYDIILGEDIRVHKISAQDIIQDDKLTIKCLFPFQHLSFLQGNDASIVLELRYKDVSYYFTGDIEESYEREVARHIERNKINILKVPHHGSKTSSTEELIRALRPDLGVISCGKRNRYGHPSLEVLKRYEQSKVPIKLTRDAGAIMTYSDGEKVKTKTMEDTELLWK